MTNRTTDPQIQEFFERMDQLNRFYQEAVVFLAAKSIGERQDGQDAPLVTVTPPRTRPLHWAGNIFRYLKRRIQMHYPGNRARRERAKTRDSNPYSQIVIDISPLDWLDDQPSCSEDDIANFPIVIHSIDEKEGDHSHE